MATLTMRRGSDPQSFLQLENRRRNIFVIQDREKEGEDISHIPIIHEGSTNEIMQHHKKALHRFQLLKKKEECDQMTAALNEKRQEFRENMERLAQRRGELNQKDKNSRARMLGFDIYLEECEKKKQRALEKYKMERKHNSIKRLEIITLKQELKKLKARREKLQKKMVKYKKFEDFLQKVVNILPSSEYAYLGCQEDSVVRALIKRHRTLVIEHRKLMNYLSVLQYDLEETQREFAALQEEYNTQKYMLISKVSELQSKCSMLQSKNITLAQCINSEEDQLTHQSREINSLLMAISNLAEQCYLRDYGPLKEMTLNTKLNMIQEFILEKMQIKEKMMPLIRRGKSSITLFQEQFQRKKSICKLQTSFLEEEIS